LSLRKSALSIPDLKVRGFSRLTDNQIKEVLCSLSALQAFREFRLEQGLSKDEAQVSLNDDIPRFFYPPEPVKAISADDLRFHMELMGLR